MSKYIDAERLNMEWQTLKPFGVTDTMIENLKWIVDRQPTIEVSEGNDCMLTMFGECSYNETGCGSCAVAEKIRKALSVEVSEDCISRAWVQNKLTKYVKDYELNELDSWQNTIVEWIATDIEDAPSVVPKARPIEMHLDVTDDVVDRAVEQIRAEGEWLHKRMPHDSYHITGQCSICKERSRINNYCPWCGAKMKGAEDV